MTAEKLQNIVFYFKQTVTAPARLELGFAPELLPGEFGYARVVPGPDGTPREESDRWEQALVLTRIASECFEAAAAAAP